MSFQTSVTDKKMYWDRYDELDQHDLERELEVLLEILLEWAELDITEGEQYQKDACLVRINEIAGHSNW